MNNAAPLPAPLHIRVSGGSFISSSRAQKNLSHFLDSPVAARVLAGTGGGVTRSALERLLGALKEEAAAGAPLATAGGKKSVEEGGKKRKGEKHDHEGKKRRKVKDEA